MRLRNIQEMTDDELGAEYNAALTTEAQVEIWEPWMEERAKALEAEWSRREASRAFPNHAAGKE